MKTTIQKEMRKIRVQLKLHDITEEKKKSLREELEKLRLLHEEEKMKKTEEDVKNL